MVTIDEKWFADVCTTLKQVQSEIRGRKDVNETPVVGQLALADLLRLADTIPTPADPQDVYAEQFRKLYENTPSRLKRETNPDPQPTYRGQPIPPTEPLDHPDSPLAGREKLTRVDHLPDCPISVTGQCNCGLTLPEAKT
jgi:hypothetical protein